LREALLLVVFLLTPGATGDDARTVLDRTKTTAATYASYDWMTGRDEKGIANDMWVAEFREGNRYRAETVDFRAVVNCHTHEGYSLNVRSGELKRDDTLYDECGVSTSGSIESVVRLPSVTSSAFGMLDVIKVTDATRIRYYQVDRRGVIMRSNWTARDGSPYPCIQAEPIARVATLPPGDIFSPKSLTTSVVATQYRRPPPVFPVTGLSGKRCGENI